MLTAVLGEVQFALGQDAMHAEIADSLRVIERAAMDGAEAIRRMQSATRGVSDAESVRIDLWDVLRDVVQMHRVRFSQDRSVAITVRKVSNELSSTINGVPAELREVFSNLILNAWDAVDDRGAIEVILDRQAGDVIVSVVDDGFGVPESEQELVFQAFYTTKGEFGNGLGLSVCKDIVERHGGRIEIRSAEGKGTTVRVTIPASADELPRLGRLRRRGRVDQNSPGS
jgi:signal transduction histidine kinase